MKKTFVLDTNVLLHNPVAIESFADNDVILPMVVLEELDKFKNHQDELGRNARQVIRRLDELRQNGNLRDGVPLAKVGDHLSGTLRIATSPGPIPDAPMDMSVPDNRIISVAYAMHRKGEPIIFVSKDINVRVKVDALGMQAVDFEKQKVNFDELFSGFQELTVPTASITRLFADKTLALPDVSLFPNEGVCLVDEADPKHSALARCLEPGKVEPLAKKSEHVWNIHPHSREQRLALELLLDPKVQLVTLVGQAGSGKTLLALAAGLESVCRNNQYKRILVTRPVVPMGKDIGYLPGDKDEKLRHWMGPIYDNLDYLMQSQNQSDQGVRKQIDELSHKQLLALEALTYIRGRSIPRQYVVVDEAQNLTPHEVKTIISRAGEDTKMVLTGDPYQIDNPYLDSASNGLSYTVERMKKLALHGHVTLRTSERSTLAAAAAENL